MKPEATVFWAIPVAAVLGGIWAWTHLDYHKFGSETKFCVPQVQDGSTRIGQDAAFYQPEDFQPFDLVEFRTARTEDALVSRVIATQGQRIKIEAGVVQVDGAPLEDPYGYNGHEKDFLPEMVVPAGCVFVMNDKRWRNNAEQFDSRAYGPIPTRAITSRFKPGPRVEGRRR